ncbi:MAG: TGS domain-containing protein [Candidatus Krumholzibacteria bacterium]|nr:TGS domain-containing protein [Candidatus Krumholzibacteria bacterium]MDP6670046.1 TGS domain-containing protein [Candidatus Krumholzibacteria bacterium]MDP6798138.1 TGS domain-containing protein [Candidatus Krumholzibacteria bacterium]MDP7022229.1 TGS domain-containing protein [Candidatus Krumholzibacteria bacterium]
MPTNLPPQYYKVEDKFKAAREPSEKIAHLREMMAIMPRHKGTDKLWAELRKKLSQLQDQIEHAAKSKGKTHNPWFIPRTESPQVLLLGAPNSGKSSVLKGLTNANVQVAEFPFSTSLPIPGMMPYKDVQIELIDTPPVAQFPLESWILDQARTADALVLFADLSAPDCCEALQALREGLEEKSLHPVRRVDQENPDLALNQRRTLLAMSKADHPDAEVNRSFLSELIGDPWPAVAFSSLSEEGLDLFRQAVWERLEMIRAYTKVPHKKAEMSEPYLLPLGATVLDLAGKVHRDFLETFQSARIWGSGKFDGQVVDRAHVLEDGDLVEITAK